MHKHPGRIPRRVLLQALRDPTPMSEEEWWERVIQNFPEARGLKPSSLSNLLQERSQFNMLHALSLHDPYYSPKEPNS